LSKNRFIFIKTHAYKELKRKEVKCIQCIKVLHEVVILLIKNKISFLFGLLD